MPFRPLANGYSPCFTCSAPAVETCLNCKQLYCKSHLERERCIDCSQRLVKVSRRELASAREDNRVLATIFGLVGVISVPIVFRASFPTALMPMVFVAAGLCIAALMKRSSAERIYVKNSKQQLSPRMRTSTSAATVLVPSGEDCDLCECRVMGTICRCEYGRDLCRRFGNPGRCDLGRPCLYPQ